MYTENWNRETIKNLAFLDRKSMKNILECGVFEGATTNYFVEELLSHDGIVVAVDPLDDEYELDGDNNLFRGQFDRFVDNTSHNKDKIWLIRKGSEQILPILRDDMFDLVFVDGNHTYNSVYEDGCNAFRIVKIGGLVLFDDYLWGNVQQVKRAVDKVLEENPNHRLLLKLNQVLIQKLEPGSPTENGQSRYQRMSIEKLFSDDKIYAGYANLDSRGDRNEKMIEEIKRIGFTVCE